MSQHTTALFEKVNHYYTKGQYKQFFELIDSALLLAEQQQNMELFVEFTLKKVSAYFYFADYEIAIQALKDIEHIIDEQPSELRARYVNSQAAIYGVLEDVDTMYKYLCEAKELAEQQKSFKTLTVIESNLSYYYLQKGRYDEALVHIERSFELSKQINYEQEQLYLPIHTRYIQIYVKQQQFEKAAACIAHVEQHEGNEEHLQYKGYLRALVMYDSALHEYRRAYDRLQYEMTRFPPHSVTYNDIYEQFVEVAEHVELPEQYVKTLETYYDYMITQQRHQQQQLSKRIDMYFKTDHLEQLIWLDALTQIKNRRYLEDHAETWLNEVKTGVAAILFDADHFKKINDTYGHAVGDEVICLMAKCAEMFFGKHNSLFVRYGGDEFFALCSVENEEQLALLLKNFHCMMQAQTYEQNKQLQISIGATFHAEPPYELEQLIHEADEALYKVKQEGRNHFALYKSSHK